MRVTLQRLGGKSGTTVFHPARTEHKAPEIEESFTDDEGNIQHILKNGNTLSEVNYKLHWGQPKGKVIPVKANYKGKSLDPRHALYSNKK